MSFSDTLALIGLIATVLGLAVTIVGFWLAIAQLKKTATASEATTNAIVAANKRMLLNHLLVLAPQLVTIEGEIDAAIAENDRKAAVRALVGFSHAAIQIAALIESQEDLADAALAVELREAANKSTGAKAGLVSGSKGSLELLLKGVAPLVASASSKCAALTTVYQVKVS